MIIIETPIFTQIINEPINMPQYDIHHETVKRALQKDGWTITHDPYTLRYGRKRLYADLGAEQLISAEKGTKKIVVKIKSFVGPSDDQELEQAIGQYFLYRQVLDTFELERLLYLAVSTKIFISVFKEPTFRTTSPKIQI